MIPASDKQDYVRPESHINTMRERLAQTSDVVVVKWSAADSMITNELKSLLKPRTPIFVANENQEESEVTAVKLRDPGGKVFHL